MKTSFLNKLAFVFLAVSFFPLFLWEKMEGLEIPVHINLFTGVPDNLGSREFLFLMWGVAVVLYLLMLLCCKYPAMVNYPAKVGKENMHKIYPLGTIMVQRMNFSIMLLFAIIVNCVSFMALGYIARFPIHIVWVILAYMLFSGIRFTVSVRNLLAK